DSLELQRARHLPPGGGLFFVSGLLGDCAVVQLDDLCVPDLVSEVVLQRAPFAKYDATIAAANFGVLSGTFRDIHLNCAAGFTVELMVEAHTGHYATLHERASKANHSEIHWIGSSA